MISAGVPLEFTLKRVLDRVHFKWGTCEFSKDPI